MKTVTLTLPEHAVRYLSKMCERDRHDLASGPELPALVFEASFDSLDAIESAIPAEYE